MPVEVEGGYVCVRRISTQFSVGSLITRTNLHKFGHSAKLISAVDCTHYNKTMCRFANLGLIAFLLFHTYSMALSVPSIVSDCAVVGCGVLGTSLCKQIIGSSDFSSWKGMCPRKHKTIMIIRNCRRISIIQICILCSFLLSDWHYEDNQQP